MYKNTPYVNNRKMVIVANNEFTVWLLTLKTALHIMQNINKHIEKYGNNSSMRKERFMSRINSFLQQNKLQKSRHGIYMVIVAYVLSFLLLIIGSDTFYGIITKAEGANEDEASDGRQNIIQEESIQEESIQEEIIQEEIRHEVTRSERTGFDEARPEETGSEHEDTKALHSSNIEQAAHLSGSGDTNWLLGYAMNDAEYDSYIQLLGMNARKDKMEQDIAKDEDKEEEIESFSVIAGEDGVKLTVTEEEIGMLERIVEAEATGEDMIGRILVANVVFNRMADEEFPDSVKGVIFHKVGGEYQFSPMSDKRYWKVEITEKTKKAVRRALEGEDYSKGAIYFMSRKRTKKSSARWFDDSLKWLFKHGAHEFYKDRD